MELARVLRPFPMALAFLALSGIPATGFAAPGSLLVPLGGAGFDMEVDLARQRVYVSVPSLNEVVIVSADTAQVINRIRIDDEAIREALGSDADLLVGTRPHGLDISLDGSLLFVALNQASSVVYVDLETLAITQVVIGAQLGDASTWDVIEGKPNRVFASANPGSGGFAWIAMIKRDQANAASRVASERIIRAEPVFARSPDGHFLYVGEGFSPNSLYKLDLSTDDAPIVLEDQHGSVSGTDHLEVSPDGSRVYLGSGQVLRTSDFIQIGLVGSGIPRLNAAGSRLYAAKARGSVEVFETAFFTKVGDVELPCAFSSLRAFELLGDGSGALFLGDDKLCGVGSGFQGARCHIRPSYAGGNLTLGFEVGTPQPALWNLWISAGGTTSRLWSLPIPVVDPPVAFDVPVPGFPQVGRIGFLTTLVGAQGITCSDFEVVDTGGSSTKAPSAQSLRRFFANGNAP